MEPARRKNDDQLKKSMMRKKECSSLTLACTWFSRWFPRPFFRCSVHVEFAATGLVFILFPLGCHLQRRLIVKDHFISHTHFFTRESIFHALQYCKKCTFLVGVMASVGLGGDLDVVETGDLSLSSTGGVAGGVGKSSISSSS